MISNKKPISLVHLVQVSLKFQLVEILRTFLKLFTLLKLIFRPINTFDIFQKVRFPTICENPNLVLNVQETNECLKNLCSGQKQPPRCFPWERCSENMLQIYRRTPMPKCDFNKAEITLRHGCSPVNLLHIFRTLFYQNTSGGLLLKNIRQSHPSKQYWKCLPNFSV